MEEVAQRPGHPGEFQRAHQQRRVIDLPAAAGAHKSPKPRLIGLSALRRLLLKGPERGEITFVGQDLFNCRDAKGPNQFGLQFRHTR